MPRPYEPVSLLFGSRALLREKLDFACRPRDRVAFFEGENEYPRLPGIPARLASRHRIPLRLLARKHIVINIRFVMLTTSPDSRSGTTATTSPDVFSLTTAPAATKTFSTIHLHFPCHCRSLHRSRRSCIRRSASVSNLLARLRIPLPGALTERSRPIACESSILRFLRNSPATSGSRVCNFQFKNCGTRLPAITPSIVSWAVAVWPRFISPRTANTIAS